VALGRAIVREPLAFLMDEPLSNLDALLRVEMRTELVRLHKRVGRTTIYVTHDQVEAMTMANRIVLMHKGVIQQVGTPAKSIRRRPTRFVATFVGSPPMNLIRGPHRIRRRTTPVPRPLRIGVDRFGAGHAR
jgi:ABC-type sugar transport system ATPase subunit